MDGKGKPNSYSPSGVLQVPLSLAKQLQKHGGGSMGVMHSQSYWDRREQRVWGVVLFVGLVMLYATRMSIPVTIVTIAQEMDWDKRMCGLILSSFYWGYMLTQVLGGHLSDRYGGDLVQWVAAVTWSLATLSIIYVTHVSGLLVILARVLTGMAQGMHYPALTSLMTQRASENERSFLYGVVNAGSHVGTIAMGTLGSLLLFHHGWHYIFVIVGVAGLLWAKLLQFISRRSKLIHRTHYKLGGGGNTATRERLKLDIQPSMIMASCSNVPWRKILLERSVLALFVAHFCHCFFLDNAMSWTPTYFHETFPSQQNSAWLYNVLPWVSMATGSTVGGFTVNWVISHRTVSMTVIRKAAVSLCLGGGALFILVVARSGGEGHFPATLLCIMLSFMCVGMSVAGTVINPSDLAPAYAGALFGLMNSVGAIPGIFGVSLTGHILQSTSSWPLVFSLMAATNFVGMLTFLAFGSGKKLQLDS